MHQFRKLSSILSELFSVWRSREEQELGKRQSMQRKVLNSIKSIGIFLIFKNISFWRGLNILLMCEKNDDCVFTLHLLRSKKDVKGRLWCGIMPEVPTDWARSVSSFKNTEKIVNMGFIFVEMSVRLVSCVHSLKIELNWFLPLNSIQSVFADWDLSTTKFKRFRF